MADGLSELYWIIWTANAQLQNVIDKLIILFLMLFLNTFHFYTKYNLQVRSNYHNKLQSKNIFNFIK